MKACWYIWLVRLLLALQFAFICGMAVAHENLPASLILQEKAPEHPQAQADHVFDVRWRMPQTQGKAPTVEPVAL